MDKRTLQLAGLLTEGAKWDDIKTMSTDDISDIGANQVFEWVKTGKWTLALFNKWVKARHESTYD